MILSPKTIALPDGTALLVRSAEEADGERLMEYLRTVCGEAPWLLRYPDEVTMTLAQERAFIAENREDPGSLLLLGFLEGRHVGNCSFSPVGSFRRVGHRCSVGIALYQAYCGRGIGRAMLNETLLAAGSAGYLQAELAVAAGNHRAAALYTSLGFQVFGRTPNAMRYDDGTLTDELLMAKKL